MGAGDTFIAGILYGLLCHDDGAGDGEAEHEHESEHEHSVNHNHWDDRAKVSFAVRLATLKVQREGFNGLGAAAAAWADQGGSG